ncbi:hypothetical protein ADL15_39645 [Actinoplanes awajinensis subsp. mycoplanecinus]|uniref:Mobilization protein n=2 Tax=Actinoplanes awajinensis TaxID=135946 RepID=A0A117MMQ9_9ACTN|nr:hypothetical protein ADL15_39645 [Actinoplanes awajinensis subsp. mycoplanecinus]
MELPARLRRRVSPSREHRLSLRLSDEELQQVCEAAGRAQLAPTGYAGEAAVAAAARASVAGPNVPATRAELATVQRELFAIRTALVGAVAVRDQEKCAAAVDQLDEVARRLHALLRRS